jgi:hypothetical protein
MDGLGEARAALLRIGAADLPQQKEHVGQRQNLLIQKPLRLFPHPASFTISRAAFLTKPVASSFHLSLDLLATAAKEEKAKTCAEI